MLEGESQQYRPAEGITWYDAVYFCNVLSDKTGLTKAYTITVTAVSSDGNITGARVTLLHEVETLQLLSGIGLLAEQQPQYIVVHGRMTKMMAWIGLAGISIILNQEKLILQVIHQEMLDMEHIRLERNVKIILVFLI